MASENSYKTENLLQKEAYEYYYSLGSGRNVKAVCDKFQRTNRTIYAWYNNFNWKERTEQRDIEVGRRMAEKTIDNVSDEKANYRKIIKVAIGTFIKDLKDGKIKVRNVVDLERLIKLDLTLMGEASEIQQHNQEVGITEADRKALEDYTAVMLKHIQSDYTE